MRQECGESSRERRIYKFGTFYANLLFFFDFYQLYIYSVQQQQYMSVLDILFLDFYGHTYSPEHAGAKVNGRVDRLAAKTTITSG